MLNTSVFRPVSLLLAILLAALAGGIGFIAATTSYDWQGLVIVGAAVGILAIFLVPRLAKIEPGGFLLKVMACGLLLKFVFTMIRSWIAFNVYMGNIDASTYNRYGIMISQYIWQLDFNSIAPFLPGQSPVMRMGTYFTRFFTGVTYSVIGPTLYGGYLIYALLSFLGSYYFYKAFRVAFPEGNKRLYAILVFLFPSILYWSNGLGKDALILLGIGLFAYGGAQLIQDRLQGLVPLALGLLGTLCIRPHIAAMLTLAFVLAFVARGVGKKGIRPLNFVLGLLVVGGFVWIILPVAIDAVGMEQLSPEDVSYALQRQQWLTYQGGSAFQVIDITKLWTFPIGLVTILFRPFPWEAHNLQALVQSLEGVLFIGIVLWRIKSLGKALAASISNTYLRYILLYIVAFVFAFSVVSNFSILARDRCMILPFVFMLIAYNGPDTRIESKPKEVMALCTV